MAEVIRRGLLSAIMSALLPGCGGGGGGDPAPAPAPRIELLADEQLHQLIAAFNLTGDPSAGRNLPSIEGRLPQLGKKLFFSKSLSGDMDTACASCHHPALGGSSGSSLAIGAGADAPDVLGVGRTGANRELARNSPTTFNVGMYDAGLFYDSRIESITKAAGANGFGSGIRTPETQLQVADASAGQTLPAAQARFPVIAPSEMLGETFERGASPEAIRNHLAARVGNYGVGAGELGGISTWLDEFQNAFVSSQPAAELITFENIALAIAEYLRSQVFVDTAWRAYVKGDNAAISAAAKRGALLFLRQPPAGVGCVRCHTGDFFTDELHHTIAFPQVGPGFGDDHDDHGRERETGLDVDRHRFRTPSLLNVEVSGPYTHTGAYATLDRVIDHYRAPNLVLAEFFREGGLCNAPQFAGDADCSTRFPNSSFNTDAALAKVRSEQVLDPDSTMPDVAAVLTSAQVADIREFLLTLTDRCVTNRSCLEPWIPDASEDPDGNQLNAMDRDGQPL
jgi:cytochrome c peroxidase